MQRNWKHPLNVWVPRHLGRMLRTHLSYETPTPTSWRAAHVHTWPLLQGSHTLCSNTSRNPRAAYFSGAATRTQHMAGSPVLRSMRFYKIESKENHFHASPLFIYHGMNASHQLNSKGSFKLNNNPLDGWITVHPPPSSPLRRGWVLFFPIVNIP